LLVIDRHTGRRIDYDHEHDEEHEY
jgi:hypothetical protein